MGKARGKLKRGKIWRRGKISLLKVSRIHLRSIQKRILAYFVARVCGHPCPWSLLGPERQIRPAGSPGRGVSPTGLTSSQSCSPRPTREVSSGSVKTWAPHLPRPLAPSPPPSPPAQRAPLACDSNPHTSHSAEGFASPDGMYPGRERVTWRLLVLWFLTCDLLFHPKWCILLKKSRASTFFPTTTY